MIQRVVHGIVHGNTIQVDSELGLPDGERIEVVIRSDIASPNWGEGLRRCAGMLADEWTEEDDRILEELYQDRRRDIGSGNAE